MSLAYEILRRDPRFPLISGFHKNECPLGVADRQGLACKPTLSLIYE